MDFLILHGSDRDYADRCGTSLPSKRAAREYALRIICELKEAGGYDDPGLAIIVQNSARDAVCELPCHSRQ